VLQLEAEVDHPEVGQAHVVEVIGEELHFVVEAEIAAHCVVAVGVVEELDGMPLLVLKSVTQLVLSHKSTTMVLKVVIWQMCIVVMVVVESNEINLFHLLISSGFDSLLEYTNESLNEKWLIPFSYGEFQKFIGTLLLSSVFNTSTEQSWNLMGSLTLNKHMSREHFVQVLTNLQRYNIRRRIIQSPNSHWTDQRNMLDHLHVLEKKNYERSIEFFFNSSYGCLVLDDKMIGSKAMDVETKIVSDR